MVISRPVRVFVRMTDGSAGWSNVLLEWDPDEALLARLVFPQLDMWWIVSRDDLSSGVDVGGDLRIAKTSEFTTITMTGPEGTGMVYVLQTDVDMFLDPTYEAVPRADTAVLTQSMLVAALRA